MAYLISKSQPAPRADDVPYDERAPGLYHGETAVELDDGTLVAVSVERHWLENGAGISFHGYARWIDADGQTQLAPTGAHVEASLSFTADPVMLSQHPDDDIATEIALVMIGEPAKLMCPVAQESGPDIMYPVVALSEEARLNASIRHQVKAVTATNSTFIGL